MSTTNKLLSLLLLMVFLVTLFTACGNNGTEVEVETDADQASQLSNQASDESQNNEADSQDVAKITLYSQNWDSSSVQSYGEVKGINEIAKRTGVEIEWKHPAVGQEDDQFNIMLASGSYPDAILYHWHNYPGGLTKALDDQILISLNEYIDNGSLPNFKKVLDANPDIEKQTMLDDGTIAFLPSIDLDLRRRAYLGFIVRKDWLDQLDMKAPETIDEWYQTLVAFKQMGKIPFLEERSASGIKMLSAAWGLKDSFYVDPTTNKIKYGPIEPLYKDYLETMNQWYTEGLIDNEFASLDYNAFEAKVVGGEGGMFRGWTASFGNYTGLIKDEDPDVELMGLKYPKGVGGQHFGTDDESVRNVFGFGMGVTTSAENVETVLRFLDYTYSDEGIELISWGIEGESFVVENGEKKYTELITNNPDGLVLTQAIPKYALPFRGWSKVYDYDAFAAIELGLPEAKAANQAWFSADKSLLLPLLHFTSEESSALANIMSEVNTYYDENFTKFIMGVEDIDSFDQFVDTIEKMDIQKAISLYQAAYDRYNNR